MLNYHHLYYFWNIAKEGHLTRAAKKLRVSQSALSAQVKLLEEYLGHDLFVREGRRLRLSEFGALVFDYADIIFATGAELLSAVQSGEGQPQAIVKIGSVATLSRNFQESFLHTLLTGHDAQFVLESGGLNELLARLESHHLHLVLSNRPAPPAPGQKWRNRLLARQQVCLIGPPRPSDLKFRFPEDLSSVELILPGLSSDVRTAFELLVEQEGVETEVFAQIDDMALLRLITINSGAVAVTPAVVVRDELESGLLENYCALPGVYENFYAITTKRQFQPKVVEDLLSRAEFVEEV